jgi:hypothetical protein
MISPCPSHKQTSKDKIVALKRRARDFMGQDRSTDDDDSYLMHADTYEYDTLAVVRMIAQ